MMLNCRAARALKRETFNSGDRAIARAFLRSVPIAAAWPDSRGHGQHMAFPPTVDGLWRSARRYARLALDAHASGQHHLVALGAGTALEHLAKACLLWRSPVLIAEFKDESSFRSVLLLLDLTDGAGDLAGGPLNPQPGAGSRLRTVGLRGALSRMRSFTSSKARWDDVQSLADMRDGVVHSPSDDEVEMRIMVAFVHHADALVADLRRDRGQFWGSRLKVADALLARAHDQVAHAVGVKLAQAQVHIRRYQPLVLDAIRQSTTVSAFSSDQAPMVCPECLSTGVATGLRDLVADSGDVPEDADVGFFNAQFYADSFACRVCNLRLTSAAEIEAAGEESEWDEGSIRLSQLGPPDSADSYYTYVPDDI